MSHASMNDDDIVFSDDEKDGEVTWGQARLFVIGFGKYKGSPLGELLTNKAGRSYLRYILTWPDLKQNARMQIQCAIDHYEHLKTTMAVVRGD